LSLRSYGCDELWIDSLLTAYSYCVYQSFAFQYNGRLAHQQVTFGNFLVFLLGRELLPDRLCPRHVIAL
jgi:hypothetical protein